MFSVFVKPLHMIFAPSRGGMKCLFGSPLNTVPVGGIQRVIYTSARVSHDTSSEDSAPAGPLSHEILNFTLIQMPASGLIAMTQASTFI